MHSQRFCALLILVGFSVFTLTACQPAKNPDDQELIGITRRADEIEVENTLARETEVRKEPTPPQEKQSSHGLSDELLKKNEWARAKTKEQSIEANKLGLASRIVANVSDLPWILIIQNRGAHVIELAALPQLLSFELTPDAPQKENGDELDTSGASSEAAPQGYLCSMKKPKKIKDSQQLAIEPEGLLVYSFDPRAYCEDAEQLADGIMVHAYFGYRPKTKKIWRRGKRVEVKVTPRAPFAARVKLGQKVTKDSQAPAEDLLGWELPSFRLGETYPLEALSALAAESPSNAALQTNNGTGSIQAGSTTDKEKSATTSTASQEQSVLQLTLSDISRTYNPGRKTITARLRNISSTNVRVLVKREAFTYQFDSPTSHLTCGLKKDETPAEQSRYTTLKPGQSRRITTRLSEACPAGPWKPGKYKISGSYSLSVSPKPENEQYFVGTVSSASQGQLEVAGAAKEPAMTLAP